MNVLVLLALMSQATQSGQEKPPLRARPDLFRSMVMAGRWNELQEHIAAHRQNPGSENLDVFDGIIELTENGYWYGNAMTAVRLFHEAGYTAHIKRPNALAMAVGYDCAGKMVARLIEYGADPKQVSVGACVSNERPAIMRFLIEKGADINREVYLYYQARVDPVFCTPLQFAARFSRMESLKILIEAKADLNAQNSLTKRTALHEAVVGKNVEGVKLLLRAKAKTNLKDKDGNTAYALAVGMKDRQLTRLLRGRR